MNLNLDVLDKVSQSYNGPSSKSSVTDILNMDIDDEQEITNTQYNDVPGSSFVHHSKVSTSMTRA